MVKMNRTVPESVKVAISYEGVLREITGKCEESVWVNEGMTFLMLLSILFASYPEIEKRYPPGALGFTVNGEPPGEFDLLKDGDHISFRAFDYA